MQSFLLALQFLTVIPVRSNAGINKATTLYFPVIGLFLGMILAGVNYLLSFTTLEQFSASVVLVILLIILTGGLHLDGLADTFDALLSRKNKSEMLRIMRDPHIGTMGVLGLIGVVLLKISFLASLDFSSKNTALILMCLFSRYAMVLEIFLFPYARDEGKAKIFFEGMNFKIFFWATLISLICAIVILKSKGLIIFILTGVFAFLIGKFIVKKIGGVSGDTLGATNELVEIFVLGSVLIF